jgi:hypothetical protein
MGTAVAYDWVFSKEDVTMRNSNSVNPDARATIRKDLVCNVQFLEHDTIPAESDTAASLVLVTVMANGSQQTETLTNMIPRGISKSFNRESPPGVVTVTFVAKGTVSIPSVA